MRQKVDFGIDLGTTNSAIAVMQDSDSVIIKSDDDQGDTTASCIAFNKKQIMRVGDKAKNAIEQEAIQNFKKREATKLNGYQEFKRNMGTNYNYESTFMD